MLDARESAIVSFSHKLEEVEERRGTMVRESTCKLVEGLIQVSYLLLPEIERLIENEASKSPRN